MKGEKTMPTPKTGTRQHWLAARIELLKAEKELTHRSDELARQRHELPWVEINKEYRFETDEGSASLADLFRGRSQLLGVVDNAVLWGTYSREREDMSAFALIQPTLAEWTPSGASTPGSTAPPRDATSAKPSHGCR